MYHCYDPFLVSKSPRVLLDAIYAARGCADPSNRILYSPLNKKELEMNALEDKLEKPKLVRKIQGKTSHEPESEKRGP